MYSGRLKYIIYKKYERQLPQGEQPMMGWTQGEQQKTELLLRGEQEVQLLQGEQPMAEGTQGEQQKTELLPRRK